MAIHSSKDVCTKIRMSVQEDMKDEFGYLPTYKDTTKALKRLIKYYAPNSYSNENVIKLINEFGNIPDRFDDYPNGYIQKPDDKKSLSWYMIFKKYLYSSNSSDDLFSFSAQFDLYYTKIYDIYDLCDNYCKLWNIIKQLKEEVRWELEPQLLLHNNKDIPNNNTIKNINNPDNNDNDDSEITIIIKKKYGSTTYNPILNISILKHQSLKS